MSGLPHVHIDIGMYPFESVRWAWDELWAAVHRRAPWTPATLEHTSDTHQRWADPNCLVTQICGWPFVSQFHEGLTALGTFVLNIPEATPNGRYRSVIVSSIDVSISELVDRCVPAAVNGDDSLSGWLSLNAAATGTGTRWPGPVVFTGSHRASLGALAEGDAVIASIDPWSLAFIEAEEPDLVRGLHQIGQGPSTPTPIVACRADVPATRRESLLAALIETVDSPKMDDVKDALHIDGFAPVDLDDYRALSALAPA